MEKKNVIFAVIGLFLLVGVMNFVYAEENLSILNISQSPSENISGANVSAEVEGLVIKSIIPNSFKVGDAQFNIKFENKGDSILNNIAPIVTGNGFSVTNVVPVDNLGIGEDDYVIIMGNFRTAGIITLNIRNGNKTFYYNVTVSDDAEQSIIADEGLIEELKGELETLKGNYTTLDYSIGKKKDDGFDVSSITLSEAKKYLRSAEASILTKDAANAEVNLKLALEEIEDQSLKLEEAREISSVDKLKNNAIIFSTIAGAIIALFTLYELLKKKSTVAVEKVKEKIIHKD